MNRKLFQILTFSLITTFLGSEGTVNAVAEESCPAGDQLTGWGQKVYVSSGQVSIYSPPDDPLCIVTTFDNSQGVRVYANWQNKEGVFSGKVTASNNNWTTKTTSSDGLYCSMYSYVYFILLPSETTRDKNGNITSCQYKICTSSKKCPKTAGAACVANLNHAIVLEEIRHKVEQQLPLRPLITMTVAQQ